MQRQQQFILFNDISYFPQNPKLLINLLEDGADVSKKNGDGLTPREYAKKLQQWEAVEAITAAMNADVLFGALKAHGKTPNLELIRSLIKTSNVTRKYNNLTIIEIAAHLGHWDLVEEMICAQPLRRDQNDLYEKLLYLCVRSDRFDTIRLFLETNSKLFSLINKPIIHEAVLKDSPEIISLLLAFGADQNAVDQDGNTAIELALAKEYWECVAALSKNPDFKLKDSRKAGQAFIKTICEGTLSQAKYLLHAGASIQEKDQNGNTPLHIAADLGMLDKVTFLLENNASMLALNAAKQTPIEVAALNHHWSCVITLIQSARADEEKNVEGLHYEATLNIAIRNFNYEVCKLLLQKNTPCGRLQEELQQNHSPLWYAIQLKNAQILQLLLEFGADPNLIDPLENKTYYEIAEEVGDVASLQVLRQHKDTTLKYDVQALLFKIDKLSERLILNDIKSEAIPEHIQEMTKLNLQLLSADIVLLNQKKYKDGFQQDILIKTLHTILNFPNNAIHPKDKEHLKVLHKNGCMEAGHVLVYLDRKEKINSYIMRINEWLTNLKNEINYSHKYNWKCKYFGFFVPGTPKHVNMIKNELAHFHGDFSNEEVLDVYLKIINIFKNIKPSSSRHPVTMHFYEIEKAAMSKLSFVDPTLATTMDTLDTVPMSARENEITSLYPFNDLPSTHRLAR